MPEISIIIPVLNEAGGIAAALEALSDYRARGCEIVVVDGGSTDNTADLARPLADHVIAAPRGRASQMNAGATIAGGDILLFLHADTQLPQNADRLVTDALASGRAWGRFDIDIEGAHILLPLIGELMNLRSLITGIATGDQAIFVRRDAFDRIGGFPDIALMEDIAISERLKRISRPACLRARVTTSGRRWEKNGVVKTILTMWRLRLMYFLGASPRKLARQYGYAPRDA